MSLSGYITRSALDAVYNNVALTTFPNVFVSLHTADPGENGQGAGEVSAGDYVRQSTAPSDWGAASGEDPATLSNTSAITWDVATVSWGTITYVGQWTGLSTTGTNGFIGAAALATSRAIATGENANFPIGSLTNTID